MFVASKLLLFVVRNKCYCCLFFFAPQQLIRCPAILASPCHLLARVTFATFSRQLAAIPMDALLCQQWSKTTDALLCQLLSKTFSHLPCAEDG